MSFLIAKQYQYKIAQKKRRRFVIIAKRRRFFCVLVA